MAEEAESKEAASAIRPHLVLAAPWERPLLSQAVGAGALQLLSLEPLDHWGRSHQGRLRIGAGAARHWLQTAGSMGQLKLRALHG